MHYNSEREGLTQDHRGDWWLWKRSNGSVVTCFIGQPYGQSLIHFALRHRIPCYPAAVETPVRQSHAVTTAHDNGQDPS